MCFTAKVLPVRILKPSQNEFFVGEIEGVFEIFETDHQSGGQAGSTVVFAVERCVCFIEALPLDVVCELTKRMIGVDLIIELCLEELDGCWCGLGRFLWFHNESNLQGILRKSLVFGKGYCKL